MKRPKRDIALLAVALIGLILASYAMTLHYKPNKDSFCNINETFNCDKVNKSPWAVFFGIPVSVLGTLSYLAVFLIVLKKRSLMRWLAFTERDFDIYLLLLAIVMFCFQLYLTYAEFFWIHAYCIVCFGSQLCTLLLGFIAFREYRIRK